MNDVPISSAYCPEAVNGHGSDSDSDPGEIPDYYQPISAVGDDDSGSDSDQVDYRRNSATALRHLPDGFVGENGVASLNINEAAVDQKSSDEDEDVDDEEQARSTETSNSAVLRAFREDESRRSAPLRPEDALRVMEAMRGVSFGGSTPAWALRVPEDQWIEQLRRMRQPPGSAN
ncbi:hypothetical protein SAY87_031257 [Trapa incisa]|uniref:Uncharacterized protein n=1 Tax=Trapa incisa TaxID=236973 RepID=A0AAN7KVQ2_9MYRT|nr:hypothetical protein SAY87_031257 [Trapa incisa]